MRASLLVTACLWYVAFAASVDPEFLPWLRRGGAEFEKLTLADIPGYGRGWTAAEDIAPGDVLASIPYGLMLTPYDAEESTLAPLLKKSALSTTNLMAVFLLHEVANADSRWAPYLRTLPRQFVPPLPVDYTAEQLQWFQGSALALFAVRRREAIARQYAQLRHRVFEAHPEWFGGRVPTAAEFQWALSILWSRSFTIDHDGLRMPGLVPLADMVNAAPYHPSATAAPQRVQTRTAYEPLAFVHYAKEAIPRGSQIFGHYSREAPSVQVLMDYGVLQLNNSNDGVWVECCATTGNGARNAALQTALDELQLEPVQLFMLRPPAISPDALLTAAVHAAFAGDYPEAPSDQDRLATASEQAAHPLTLVSAAGIARAYDLWRTALQDALQRYAATSIEEDHELLHNGTALSYVEWAAVTVRLREKAMLRALIALCRFRGSEPPAAPRPPGNTADATTAEVVDDL